MSAQQGSDQTIGTFVAGVGFGLGGVAIGANWLIGNLASLLARRQPLDAGLGEALRAVLRLPDHWSDPRLAWSEPAASELPGPVLYWASAAVVLAVLLCVIVAVVMRMNRRHEAIDQRRRVGVDTQAQTSGNRSLASPLTSMNS